MRLVLTLGFTIFILSSSVIGQDHPSGVGIRVRTLLLDYQSQNGGDITAFNRYHHGWEVGFLKHLTNGLYASVPFRAGIVQHENELDGFHKTIASADLQLQYHFFKPSQPIIPYLTVGAGYVYEKDGLSNIQIPVGLGFNFRITNRAHITWQSEYRYSLESDRHNLQHGIGISYFFGKPEPPSMLKDSSSVDMPEKKDIEQLDSDGDGIPDVLDLCPQEAGSKELDGCPDRDGDGVPDYKDQCPDEFGLIALRGCPDSDGDGVSDHEDECPKVHGTIENKGCPEGDMDSDGDGVPDHLDKCPNVPGPASNAGCPDLDSDGDGVPDSIDKCPNVPGPKNTLGCPDQDGDGIPDYEDRCPTVPGSITNYGCPDGRPDSDGDGVPDHLDRCPNVPGPAIFSGCPDTDGDGIPDIDDQCPDLPGDRANKGCPESTGTSVDQTKDKDGDGVPDHLDNCPDVPGPAIYDGCPDTDGDGIDDSRDRCPNTPGPVYTQGCPEVAPSDQRVLEIAMRSVQFESGQVAIKSESFNILRQIAEIMTRYPDFNLTIGGHTDAQGNAVENQILSEKRAKACYDFLINSGVSPSRMSYAGYGQSRPVATNQTISGRTLNRRVEFALVPRF